jgi:hypothetical protein
MPRVILRMPRASSFPNPALQLPRLCVCSQAPSVGVSAVRGRLVHDGVKSRCAHLSSASSSGWLLEDWCESFHHHLMVGRARVIEREWDLDTPIYEFLTNRDRTDRQTILWYDELKRKETNWNETTWHAAYLHWNYLKWDIIWNEIYLRTITWMRLPAKDWTKHTLKTREQ